MSQDIEALPYRESIFSIPKMDCPSEENLIRMALGNSAGVQRLSFNLAARELTAVHQGDPDLILGQLLPLKLGATLRESVIRQPEAEGKDCWKTIFSVPKMDCSSEENLIRMALSDVNGITSLNFDLVKRQMTAVHRGNSGDILNKLQPLNMGVALLSTTPATSRDSMATESADNEADEFRMLRLLLVMNAAMFLIELFVGFWAESTGLVADSLDMLADASVYGLAILAVGKAAHIKVRAAHLAGWLQIILALMALLEVGRNFFYGSDPRSTVMIVIGLIALVVNATSLVLIARRRTDGAHLTASYIFTANDVVANLGVVLAGALVAWTKSPYPDLVIGLIITVVVLNGARRILQLK